MHDHVASVPFPILFLLYTPCNCENLTKRAIWATANARTDSTLMETSIIWLATRGPWLVPSIRVSSTNTEMYHSKFVINW